MGKILSLPKLVGILFTVDIGFRSWFEMSLDLVVFIDLFR